MLCCSPSRRSGFWSLGKSTDGRMISTATEIAKSPYRYLARSPLSFQAASATGQSRGACQKALEIALRGALVAPGAGFRLWTELGRAAPNARQRPPESISCTVCAKLLPCTDSAFSLRLGSDQFDLDKSVGVVPEIDIWRVAALMVNRYADDAEVNAD